MEDAEKEKVAATEAVTKQIDTITSPLNKFMLNGVKGSLEFQEGLEKLNSVMNLSSGNLKDFGTKELKLSNETGVSVDNLNNIGYKASEAGVSNKNLIKFEELAAKLSTGSKADPVASGSILTSVYNTYKDKYKEQHIDQITAFKQIADSLSVAQNNGAGTVANAATALPAIMNTSTGLQTVMRPVTALSAVMKPASAVGVNLNQMLSERGALMKGGMNVSEADSALGNVFSRLSVMTPKIQDMTKSIGMSFKLGDISKDGGAIKFLDELKANIDNIPQHFIALQEKIKKLKGEIYSLPKGKASEQKKVILSRELVETQKQEQTLKSVGANKTGVLKSIFGDDGTVKTATKLISTPTQNYQKQLMSKINKGSGDSEASYNKMGKTANGKMQTAMNSIKNSSITVGNNILPIISNVMNQIAKLTTMFGNLKPAVQGNIAGVLLIGGGFLKTFSSVLKLVTGFKKMKDALGVLGVFTKVQAAMGGIKTAFADAGAAIGLLRQGYGLVEVAQTLFTNGTLAGRIALTAMSVGTNIASVAVKALKFAFAGISPIGLIISVAIPFLIVLAEKFHVAQGAAKLFGQFLGGLGRTISEIGKVLGSVGKAVGNFFGGLFGSKSNDKVKHNLNSKAVKAAINGSHANGLAYVPFDNYVAKLHKGERVLNAQEAKNYNNYKLIQKTKDNKPVREIQAHDNRQYQVTININGGSKDKKELAQEVAYEFSKIMHNMG